MDFEVVNLNYHFIEENISYMNRLPATEKIVSKIKDWFRHRPKIAIANMITSRLIDGDYTYYFRRDDGIIYFTLHPTNHTDLVLVSGNVLEDWRQYKW